jgi:hypothetical protein
MADSERAAKTAAVMATLSTAVSLTALFKKSKAEAAPPGTQFPPEVLEILSAIAEAMGVTIEYLASIADDVENLQLGNIEVKGYPPNADYATTTRIQCQVANQVYPVPSLAVPDDFDILIKAWPLNAVGSLIFVITNPSPNQNMSYALVPNEPIRLRLKDTGKISIFTNIAGSQATVTVEQRSS